MKLTKKVFIALICLFVVIYVGKHSFSNKKTKKEETVVATKEMEVKTIEEKVPEVEFEEETEEKTEEAEQIEEIEEEEIEEVEETSTGIRPEFKDAMDSYEAFFDEYVEFMEKYKNSNDQTGMMMDYLTYLAKYEEAMVKLDKLEDDLNDEELLYYNEVLLRIDQKLLKVAY